MNREKPVLYILTGLPGSGKSFFAEHMSKHLGAVWVGVDPLRSAMFSDVKAVKVQNPELYYTSIFNGLDYVTRRILLSGASVVYEAMNKQESRRRALYDLAIECNAKPVIVLVESGVDESLRRATTREETDVQFRFLGDSYQKTVDTFEPIEFTDSYISIDGTADIKTQQIHFDQQFSKIARADTLSKSA